MASRCSSSCRQNEQLSWIAIASDTRVAMSLTFALWLLVLLLSPIGTAFEMGADEHFELNKAVFIQEGYRSNVDFWNDQPPLLSLVVAKLFQLMERSALYPRLMVQALSLLYVLGMQSVLFRVGEGQRALLFAILLLGAPEFLGASMTLMADPVKVPLCLLSYVLMARGGSTGQQSLIFAAGMVFGLAAVIKFTAALYLPGLLLALVLSHRRSELLSWKRSILLFSFGAALWLPYLLSLLVPFSDQLLGAHVVKDFSPMASSPGDYRFGWQHFSVGLPLWVGGLFAVGLVLKRQLCSKRLAFPMTVIVAHLLVAAFHSPWWDYYLLDFWPCLAWLSAESLGWTYAWIVETRKRGATGIGLHGRRLGRLSLAVLLVSALPAGALIGFGKELARVRQKTRIKEVPVIGHLRATPPKTSEFLFSNQPMVAFHSGWCLPPQLGVLSLKRFWSGAMDHEQMVEELMRVKVSRLYFGGELREINPAVLKFAEDHLGRSESVGDGILFTRDSENPFVGGKLGGKALKSSD